MPFRLSHLVVLALLVSGPAVAQERALVLATEAAYPPFNSVTADGQVEGFDIDIGNALCTEMRVKCTWVIQDWDGMIPALQAGKFDAIVSSMFITEERKKQVNFTDRYYSTPPAMVVRKEIAVRGAEPEDLTGVTIGVQGSSVYAIYAEQFLQHSIIKTYPAIPELIADLVAGRIDAINDDLVVLDAFLKTPEGVCCRLAGTIEPIPTIHGPGAGIVLRKGDPRVAEFNSALRSIRAKNIYKTINDRYFDFDLFGNGAQDHP